jgi:hypothetical protein
MEAVAEAMFRVVCSNSSSEEESMTSRGTFRVPSTCPCAWVATADQWSPTIALKNELGNLPAQLNEHVLGGEAGSMALFSDIITHPLSVSMHEIISEKVPLQFA